VATLTRVDAFIASMLVGRLLTDVLPALPHTKKGVCSIFSLTRSSQLPLSTILCCRLCASGDGSPDWGATQLHVADLIQWFSGRPVDPKTYHEEVATKLTELLLKYNLYSLHRQLG